MVMPFANQTGDKEKDYIADALTSSITSDLTRIRDAFIVPATTAFSLRGKQLTVPQLGKEAAVRFVLTGSVTSDKERLRINSVLSDTQTGAQLWTENFDGKQTDMFALQDQVTTRIGNTIGPQMVILAARESEKRSNTPQVADLLMRARALELDQISLKNLQAREALYRQSLALEPSDLAAQVGLALSLAMQSWGFASDLKLDRSGRVALAKQAGEMLQSVKRIEPNNPKIHFALSTVASVTGDVTGAVLAARRLVELEPKEYWSHIRLGLALQAAGDTSSARAALQHAMQLASPARPPGEALFLLSVVAFIEDRPDEVLQLAQKAIQVNPNNAINHLYLALGYARKGDQVQARRAAADAVRINPNLKLSIKNETPWPGKEAAYLKYVETQYLPAWRLAGLPE